jgi:hypothetical protein
MVRCVLPVVLIAGLPMALAVANPATVAVGGELKPYTTIGIVVGLENADTACNVELQLDDGRRVYEAADFDLCFQEPSLVGRRVALTWTVANVQAESCGGDPECSDSERIALISAARIVDGDAVAPGQASFCTAAEDVIFACRVGAKLVSVCAAQGSTVATGYVQYRYGKPDSAEPLELQLPDARIVAAQAATGENVPFAGGGTAWMRFRRGDYAYVVYSGVGQWGPQGETEERAGVVVERGGQQIAALRCNDDRAAGELGPDWFERVGVVGKGEAFELPE